MTIETWFPTLIYYDFLNAFDEYNPLLAQRAYQMRSEQHSSVDTDWYCDTFNTLNSNNYLKGDEIDDVIKKLILMSAQRVEEYAQLFDADLVNYNLVCDDFWFNIAQPGNFQELHQHPNTHFSVVYYVQAAENAGNIVFKSMESITDAFAVPTNTVRLNPGSNKTCSYTPVPSKILIFRSNLMHMVNRNDSDRDRVSIAMNFRLDRNRE